MNTNAMNANVAVLYDIENLIAGYSPTIRGTNRLKPNISMKAVLNKIKHITGFNQEIAIQRAYANWTVNTVKYLRKEVKQMNIKTVDMAGMPYHGVKNAADFHLVVDAIHLIYKHPEIDTYILVTGDGGFSVLANALQKQGKKVIGCALASNSSNVFQRVCNNFILLRYREIIKKNTVQESKKIEFVASHSISDTTTEQGKASEKQKNSAKSKLSKTKKIIKLIHPYVTPLKKSEVNNSIKEQAIMTDLLGCFVGKGVLADKIKSKGMAISLFRNVLYGFLGSEFDFKRYGDYNFFEFLDRMFRDTPLCLIRKEGDIRIGLKEEIMEGYEQWIIKHSIENYRNILLKNSSLYRLPAERCTLYDVLVELKMSRSLKRKTFSVLAKNIALKLGTSHITMVKNVLHVLVLANCFDEKYKNFPFMERPLTLKRELRSEQAILTQLREHLKMQLKTGLTKGVQKGVDEFVLGSFI
jgi:uncharacterized LabA/DUF88 family protein